MKEETTLEVVNVCTSEIVVQFKYNQKPEWKWLKKSKDLMAFVEVVKGKDNYSYYLIDLFTGNSRLLYKFNINMNIHPHMIEDSKVGGKVFQIVLRATAWIGIYPMDHKILALTWQK
jgi:hypothetical protein